MSKKNAVKLLGALMITLAATSVIASPELGMFLQKISPKTGMGRIIPVIGGGLPSLVGSLIGGWQAMLVGMVASIL